MTTSTSLPSRPRPLAKRGDPCNCKDAAHGGKCANFTAERGWFFCPPCGRKWHQATPCDSYNPGRQGWDYAEGASHVAPCKTCGYVHGKGSNGNQG